MNTIDIHKKCLRAISSWTSSFSMLFVLFFVTMLKHYDGSIDTDYLGYGAVKIVAVSVAPLIFSFFVKSCHITPGSAGGDMTRD